MIFLLLTGGYFGYKTFAKTGTATRYVLAAATKGTLTTSVSGSGQISASNQIDIKSKVSGDVVYANIKNGQEVKSGTLLVQVDSSSAQKSVRDAETALETAKLDLEEALEPIDELSLLQAENSLLQLKESLESAKESLSKSQEDSFNAVVNAFFDLPGLMTDMENIFYGNNINISQDNIDAYSDMAGIYDPINTPTYKNIAASSYSAARTAYDENFKNYKAANRNSDAAIITSLLNETYETSKKIASAIKDADNFISFVKDTLTLHEKNVPALAATHQSLIKTNTSKINSIISSLSSIKKTVTDNQNTIVKTERSIAEKELSNAKLKAGTDNLTIRAKRIAVQQKEDALAAARENLADYYIRAPFDGVITSVSAKKGDSLSSGGAIATIITKQRVAGISLNEVDIAKVKAEQKVNLTFDAVSDLNITGEVAEVDSLGTVSQGVVTYDVKIIFDTQDERIKPGMSVSASIITDVKQDVLMIANSAIKSLGDIYYVETLEDAPETAASAGVISNSSPKQQVVEIGLANDSYTEIVNGLNEGDKIITRTISNSSASKSSSSGTSLLQMGGTKTGTSATRIQTTGGGAPPF